MGSMTTVAMPQCSPNFGPACMLNTPGIWIQHPKPFSVFHYLQVNSTTQDTDQQWFLHITHSLIP